MLSTTMRDSAKQDGGPRRTRADGERTRSAILPLADLLPLVSFVLQYCPARTSAGATSARSRARD